MGTADLDHSFWTPPVVVVVVAASLIITGGDNPEGLCRLGTDDGNFDRVTNSFDDGL